MTFQAIYFSSVQSIQLNLSNKLFCNPVPVHVVRDPWKGTIHKHLLKGPDAKREALIIFDLCKGALEKTTTIFPVKIKFTCFSMGLTCNFHGKNGGP